jgi:hypothetical protein
MQNQIRYLVVTTVIVFSAFTGLYAQSSTDSPRNEVEINATFSIPSGNSKFSTTTAAGSTVDLGRDFDFKDEFGFDLRYIHRSANGKHKLLAEYTHTDWSRTGTATRTIVFEGQTFVANATLSGDLNLGAFRGMYAYRWGNDKVRIGPMVDLGVITTKLAISGTTNNGVRSGEGSISKFAATVGYDLDYNPTPKINVYNNMGGIVFQGEHLFHVDGGVKYFPAKHFGVNAGYKAVRYKITDNDNFINIRTHGPFFGGAFRF